MQTMITLSELQSSSSAMKPLVKPLRLLSYLGGHLFDSEKLESSEGRVFAKGRWTKARKVVIATLTFATFIVMPIFSIQADMR